jgi:hypothetical protein
MSIFYQNVRGLRTKTNDAYLEILKEDYDLICLTETWLHSNITSEELFDERYLVLRRDRGDTVFSNRSMGGGVLIAVKRTIKVIPRPEWNSEVEDIWITIVAEDKSQPDTNICVAYIPPDTALDLFQKHLDKCMTVCLEASESSSNIILCDYNLPSIEWNTGDENCMHPTRKNGPKAEIFMDMLYLSGLKQFNGIFNNHSGILDLVLSSAPVQVSLADGLVNPDGFHPPLVIDFANPDALECLRPNSERIRFNFRKTNYSLCKSRLSETDWSFLGELGCNDALQAFYNIIWQAIECHTPKLKPNPRDYPIWYSSSLIRMIEEKNKHHKNFKKYGNLNDRNCFSLLRTRIKKAIKDCHRSYISSVENSLEHSPKAFWSYVNSKKQSNSIPREVKYRGVSATKGENVCELFASFFSSVFIESTSRTADESSYMCHSLSQIYLERAELFNIMNTLDTNKGTGSDDIPNLFVRECAGVLVEPLFEIFKKSLCEGIFPDLWKISRVVPIYKSGDRTCVENYRPISLLPCFGRLFEKMVYPHIYHHVSPLLTKGQHGFVSNKSTGTNLSEFVNQVSECLDSRIQVDAVYTDFSKAFDRVDYGILLRKLRGAGIVGKVWDWISSYLDSRVQVVSVGGFDSGPIMTTSGVPQGSHLGPLLFVLFINDLGSCLSSEFLMYADDLKIYTSVKCIGDCLKLQSDLNKLSVWCSKNNMRLNTDKCHSISFTRNKKKIDFTYNISGVHLQKLGFVRDLGVILDSELSFRDHYDHITEKSYKTMGFLFRITKPFKDPNSLIRLYYSLIRSLLEYQSFIWSPYYVSHKDKIERVQRYFTRVLSFRAGHSGRLEYQERLSLFKMESLSARRSVAELMYLRNLVQGCLDTSDIELLNFHANNRLRSSEVFRLKRYRTNVGQFCPINRMMSSYNGLSRIMSDLDIFHNPVSTFKRLVRSNLVVGAP